MAIMTPQASLLMWLIFSLLVPEKTNHPSPPAAQMYKYVSAQSQFCANVHVGAFSKDIDKRLLELRKHPLVQALPGHRRFLHRFLRQIQRIRKASQKEIKRDVFTDLHFVTACFYVQRNRPRIGTINTGLQFTEAEFRGLASIKRNAELQSAHGFTVQIRKYSRESLALSPEGSLLVLDRNTAKDLIKQGPSVLQNQALQSLMIQNHQSDQLVSVGAVMNNELQQALQDSVGTVTQLFAGWRTFYATTSLTQAKAKIETSDADIARRSKLFLEGIRHMGLATAFYGQGLFHGLQGLLDMPNPERRSPTVRKLVRNKAQIFALLRTYLGEAKSIDVKIASGDKSVALQSTGPLNRVWGFVAVAIFGQIMR
ncbi:MAG: hypothetical protein H6728_12915 [Myxococcales bacterium]|nr:hypothetical protein [Myxococcales bacterium]MCB9643969.1 hypothetical protein [Myxococcales bacterium]